MKLELGDIQETMLIPLVIKANETMRKHARIHDPKAVEIVKTLGINRGEFDRFMSHEGVVARTIMFDEAVNALIRKYPDCTCVNLGCGLDDRFSRVDNGKIFWYDIDLPDVIRVREKVFQDTERRRMISGSALEKDWISEIRKAEVTLVIVEGVFMYFTEEEVKTVLNLLTEGFSGLYLVCELMSRAVTGHSRRHDTVSRTNASFRWGVNDGSEVSALCKKLVLLREESFNREMKKYSLRAKAFAAFPLTRKLNNRIAIFEKKP